MRAAGVLFGILAVVLAGGTPTVVSAKTASQEQIQQSIGFDQRIGARLPGELRLRDADGRSVRLEELLGGRPTVFAMAWYSCRNLCPITLRNLSTALAGIPFKPERDFNVITISIDPHEGDAEARQARRSMLTAYGRGKPAGWHVLTGDGPTIRRITDAVGFRYTYDKENQQYAHPAGLVLLDGTGRVSRYLFGLEFAARDLKLGLLEAGRGELGSPIDQLVLRCHSFDPSTGQYTLAVMTMLRAAGSVTVLALVGFIAFRLVRELRQSRPNAAEKHR